MRDRLSLVSGWNDILLHRVSLITIHDFLERWMDLGRGDYAVLGTPPPDSGMQPFQGVAFLEFTPDPLYPVELALGNPFLGIQMFFHQPGNPQPVVMRWGTDQLVRFSFFPYSRLTGPTTGKPALEVKYQLKVGHEASFSLIAL